MPTTDHLPVKSLKLDLANLRTIPQADETHALHALVSIAPNYFWGITESLLDKGYLATENIVTLNAVKNDKEPTVKEGNRRVGALKLILGQLDPKDLAIPDHIQNKIAAITTEWKIKNSKAPCLIYEVHEADDAEEVVSLTHGKGEFAGRLDWNAVGRARHNRDINDEPEPALDFLEKYLKAGKNITPAERELWAGVYPLTILAEATNRVTQRLGFQSVRQLVDGYPDVKKYREALENMLHDIGTEALKFPIIRDAQSDFAFARYGIPLAVSVPSTATSQTNQQGTSAPPGTTTSNATTQGGASTSKKTNAVGINDARSVTRKLRSFAPKGPNREKLVTLIEEAKKLKLKDHRYAFCFVLRSMFELSAKAYCKDHPSSGIKAMKDNRYRKLKDVLDDITKHLTKSGKDKEMNNLLHGAMSHLAKPKSILSVESLNQLVHNPDHTITEEDICSVFSNVFPLLLAMNR